MDEKQFEAELNRASAHRARQLEEYQERSRKRETVLGSLIRSNRVRVDYVEVDRELSGADLRAKFEVEMRRAINRQATHEADLQAMLAEFEDD